MSGRFITRYVTYFKAPISNTEPTVNCTLQELYKCIREEIPFRELTVQVRMEMPNEKAYKRAKTTLLPLVTPTGVFTSRNLGGLVALNGLGVLDFDHLESMEAAIKLRDALFADSRLKVELAFVSPSGHGVKVFLPYKLNPELPLKESYRNSMRSAWEYVRRSMA